MNSFILDLDKIIKNLNEYYLDGFYALQGVELLSCNDTSSIDKRVYKVQVVESNLQNSIVFYVIQPGECVRINTLAYLKEFL